MQRTANEGAVAVAPHAAPVPAQYALSRTLATLAAPADGPAEAIRALRTHIMAQHVEQGRRALAVCAPTGAVGCTYIATNLAVAMAQIGVKTLLIDGNLRQPSVDQVIRPDKAPVGLAQCLEADDDNYSAYLETDVLQNLSIMYAGGTPANPQELLARERFDVLMNQCLRDFDLTLVDTPPANTCSDARRVATVLGYGMVVARRNATRVHDMKTLIEQLQADHAKVIGTVLNEF